MSGTERAAVLTKRLLAFSRRQPLDPRPVDVNRLILDMTELLHRTPGKTIVIETHLSAEVPNALVDGNQLENAIINLAINARDAMPRGGRLEITTRTAELDSTYVAANADARRGNYVRIQVKDHGHGMSEEVLSRVIEPFFSTKEVGQGTGLGLSMVYGFKPPLCEPSISRMLLASCPRLQQKLDGNAAMALALNDISGVASREKDFRARPVPPDFAAGNGSEKDIGSCSRSRRGVSLFQTMSSLLFEEEIPV